MTEHQVNDSTRISENIQQPPSKFSVSLESYQDIARLGSSTQSKTQIKNGMLEFSDPYQTQPYPTNYESPANKTFTFQASDTDNDSTTSDGLYDAKRSNGTRITVQPIGGNGQNHNEHSQSFTTEKSPNNGTFAHVLGHHNFNDKLTDSGHARNDSDFPYNVVKHSGHEHGNHPDKQGTIIDKASAKNPEHNSETQSPSDKTEAPGDKANEVDSSSIDDKIADLMSKMADLMKEYMELLEEFMKAKGGDSKPTPTPTPPPKDGDSKPVPVPMPPPNDGDSKPAPKPTPPPSDGESKPAPKPTPPPSDSDSKPAPVPTPPPNDGDDSPFPPGGFGPPKIDPVLDGVLIKPPAPYGQGAPFPDRGKSSGADVKVDSVSADVRQLEENGIAPKPEGGLTFSATQPAPEIWKKIETKDGKVVYMAMQQATDTNPFDGKSVYQKRANGGLTVDERISFDPLAQNAITGGINNSADELYYRGTDGNLHQLNGQITHEPGSYHGSPSEGFYKLKFDVPKDMAFVRQQWQTGSGHQKIAEKFLIDGKIVTLSEAERALT